jgi:hypothetical protein
MINHEAIHLAARARARTLSVAQVAQTFARASDATYVDGDGLLQTVGPNVYRGFLEASGATNLLTAPNDFTNAAWRNSGDLISPASAVAATGPDGALSGATLSGRAIQEITALGTGTFSASVFVKMGTASQIFFGCFDGSSTPIATGRYVVSVIWNGDGTIASFFENAGAANGDLYAVEPLANGWYRLGITFNSGSAARRVLYIGGVSSLETCLVSRVMLTTGTDFSSYTPDTRAPESGDYFGLAATTAGYSRTSGSFVTDGFAVGMDVTPSGFTQTSAATITSVSALAMVVRGGRTAQTVGAATLTSGLPALIGYENISITPTTDTPYCVEEYLPGALAKVTVGAFGELEATPLYVLRLLYPQHTGMTAIRRTSDALLTLFAPGTPLTVGSDIARVRSDLAPFPSPITQTEDGWASCTVTIPLRLRTANSR